MERQGAAAAWWRGRAAFAALALGLYAAATAALLWPLARQAGEVVALADGSGDSGLFLWNLWWVRQVLAGDPGGLPGQSLLHTRMLFWPEGVSLAYHTLAPTLGVLAAPLQWAWPGTAGLVRALNLMVGLSFVLTAGAVLLLARQAGASRGAALGAGLLALLQPYRLHHLNHLNLLSLQFGLLSLWWLVRVLRGGRKRDAVGLAVTALLASGTDLEGTAHVALAAALLTGWTLWSGWRGGTLASLRAGLRALGLATGLALLLHLPLLLALRAAGPVLPPPPGAAEILSANLAGFALPGPQGALHAPAAALGLVPLARVGGLVGDEVSLGALFLCAVALLLARGRRGAGPWLLVGGVLLALSLGPTLHLGGLDGGRGLMPWAWLAHLVPTLSLSRAPVRLVHLGGMALAVALAVLLDRSREASAPGGGRGWRGRAAVAAVFLLLAAERWPVRPVQVERVAVPAAYLRLAAEPGPFAILQSPEDDYLAWMRFLTWQTAHRKPMVLGYVSRLPAGAGRWLPGLRALPPPEREARLREAGVRYLVAHPPGDPTLGAEPVVTPTGGR